jgi:hypothetical protein
MMKKLLLVTALAGGMFAVVAPNEAMARDRLAFSFDTGGVAFAYSDGYWDRDRRWHRWRDANERRMYRRHFAHNYYDHPRSRARNMGWRDFDRDGVPNRYDRDRDNDGVPNRYDRRPNNPYRN